MVPSGKVLKEVKMGSEVLGGLSDLIEKWGQSTINSLLQMDDSKLQAIITRPFIPSPFNPNFDFEKYCASIIFHYRKKWGIEL